MKNIKFKELLKTILLSIVTLLAGYFALSLPFHLFDQLTNSAMRIIFAVELFIYVSIGLIFIVVNDKKKQEKKKRQQKQIARQMEKEKLQEQINQLHIAA